MAVALVALVSAAGALSQGTPAPVPPPATPTLRAFADEPALRAAAADYTRNVTATELYDHRGAAPYPTDFDASENENVAANASHAAVVAELGARLRAMFP